MEVTMDGPDTIKTGHRSRGARRLNRALTIADVAREANCSPMTVSRDINGEGNVRESTRDQVLDAIRRLNYSPNRAARSLAGGEQLRIAILFDNPSASYLSEFLMGELEEATSSDIHLVAQACDNLADTLTLVRKLAESVITVSSSRRRCAMIRASWT
jgi:LacI family transcriptional regulator